MSLEEEESRIETKLEVLERLEKIPYTHFVWRIIWNLLFIMETIENDEERE